MAKTKEELRGQNPDNSQQGEQEQQTDPVDQNMQQKRQESSGESQEQQQTQNQQPQQQSQEQGQEEDLTKYDNVVKQTFGIPEDQINDYTRKMAKSWASQQSEYSKLKSQYNQEKQDLDRFNQILESNPDLKEEIQKAKEGKRQQKQENSQQESQSSEKPKSGNNSGDVDEQTLIQQGYLTEGDLEGLTELERQNKKFKAELQYDKDQTLNEWQEQRQKAEQEQEQKKTQEQKNQVNQDRANKGFDDLVAKGVNLSELPDDQFNSLISQMKAYRDPNDMHLLDENALELAAYKQGLLSQQNMSNDQQQQKTLNDTGFSTNKQQPSNETKDINQELTERAKDKYRKTGADPKAAFRQNT